MKHLLADSQQASCPGISESSLNGDEHVAACQSTQGNGISCMCGESGGVPVQVRWRAGKTRAFRGEAQVNRVHGAVSGQA